ncbi:hypothetical protein ACPPVT_03330 [Angustibacter sp. McL0619]|uniref:hypothetical protein n=1 Tax=Angustibacter sp. McL0619 TaxID=3415676 RepID=UPI003CEBACCC
MPEQQITIDEHRLDELKSEYTAHQADATRAGKLYPWPTDAGGAVSGDLSVVLPLRLGADAFPEGVSLKSSADAVRLALAARVAAFADAAYQLEWGLTFLLRDADATETFNEMTAQQFASYIPVTPGGSGGSAAPASAVTASAVTARAGAAPAGAAPAGAAPAVPAPAVATTAVPAPASAPTGSKSKQTSGGE